MEEENTGTDLVTIQNITMADLFTKPTMNKLLDEVELAVANFVPDLTTDKGRKAIASMAMKVSKSKVFLEEKGKDFVADRKKELKEIDEVRAYMKDRLDKLRDEVRKPLTEWENKEKERVAKHELNLKNLQLLGQIANQGMALGLSTLKYNRGVLNDIVIDKLWQEYESKALTEKAGALATLDLRIQELEKYEADQAELKRLKAEEEERKKKEHEEAIARKAKEEAEAKAKRDKEEADRKAQEEIDRAKKSEQLAIDNQRRAEEAAALDRARADELAKKAKADKEAADIRAKEEAKLAADRAVEAEKKRVQEQKDREAAELKKREADVEHRKKINREVMAALQKVIEDGYADELNAEALAKEVTIALAKNQVPHTRITY